MYKLGDWEEQSDAAVACGAVHVYALRSGRHMSVLACKQELHSTQPAQRPLEIAASICCMRMQVLERK